MSNLVDDAMYEYERLFARGNPYKSTDSPGDKETDPTIANAMMMARNISASTTSTGHIFGDFGD